jgi:hypothetical protein
VEFDATLLKLTLKSLGCLLIGAGDDLVEHLENMNLAPHVRQERRKFTANHATADHGDPLWLLRPIQCVI